MIQPQTSVITARPIFPGMPFPALKKGTLKRVCVLLLVFVIAIAGSEKVTAQVEVPEYQVKAAFLYKFATYVEWPVYAFPSSESPIVFGVVGADVLADFLEEIVRDRKLHDRSIEVRRLAPGGPSTGVHVLFVGQSQGKVLDYEMLDAAITSTLTVTETDNGRPEGSVINFETIDDRVRFDVSLTLAEQANLRISSRLLQVAHRVISETL